MRKSSIPKFVILEIMKNRIKRKYFWIKLFITNEQSTNSESHTKKNKVMSKLWPRHASRKLTINKPLNNPGSRYQL